MKARKLRLDSLESRKLLSVNVPEVEPNDTDTTATAFVLDAADQTANLTGSIATEDDRDFFRFSPNADGPIHLNASSPDGLGVKVAVEDSAGNKLFETEPNDGVLSGNFAVTAGQRIFVRVEGAKSIGSYAIRISHTPDDNGGGGDPGGEPANVFNEKEVNDTTEQANVISLGSDNILQFRGVADGTLDQDYFKLTASHAGRLDINILPSVAEQLNIEVKDANGDKITEIETYYGTGRGSVHLEAGETIYLRMKSIDTDPSPYAVDLVLSDSADFNGDGRVDASDAGAMFANFGGSGMGDLNGDGIVDAADAGILFERWSG